MPSHADSPTVEGDTYEQGDTVTPQPNLVVRLGRPAATALTGLVASVALSACGGSAPASGDVRPGPANGEAVSVVAFDNVFEPTLLRLQPGSEVTVEVANDGAQPHNFVIDEADLSSGTLAPGDVASATFKVPDEPVTFYCSFHRDMTGTIELGGQS